MAEVAEQLFTPEIVENALTYQSYRSLIDELLEEGKVTGDRQSEALAEYTKMNVHRMNRLDKRTELQESLKETLRDLDTEMTWLVLTEGWCGDAAQSLPVIAKIANESPNIELGLLLRHQYEAIMDHYETDGARSIPKLIALEPETLSELGSWGPRPEEAQRLVYDKWMDSYSRKEWARKLHKWYADNGTQDIQEEFEVLIERWKREM
ncbi:thioredoxin family protein [Halalkalibaculum sp. DA3122]|uniref:thioredoxin family protein n=1 Tax=Halalkalibaculum sp. DA3122 TaxID=3373607 RepID=UPI00375427F9